MLLCYRIGMTTLFCFDFDETLSNTDRLRADLEAGITAIGGEGLTIIYKKAYEQVREEQGTVRMPLVLRAVAERSNLGPDVHRSLARMIHELPYQNYIYPGSEEAVRQLKALGKVILFSDGDAFFQAQKVYATSIANLVDEVVILPNKVSYFNELEGFWPTDRYVFIDDKQRVLDAAKQYFGDRAVTVLVKQGRYAQSSQEPLADYSVDSIGEVAQLF